MFFNTIIFLTVSILVTLVNPFFERYRLPQAAIVIVLGVGMGPFGLGVFEYGEIEEVISEIAVILILFSAGYEIRWSRFLAAIKPGLIVGLAGIIFSMLLGFMSSYLLTGKYDEALYIGIALTATSIGISVPVLHRAGVLDSKVGQILLAAAIVDDVLALYLLSAAHVSLTTNDGIGLIIYSLMLSLLVLSILCGLVWGIKTLLYQTIIGQVVFARRAVALFFALLSAWLTHRLGLSPIVGGFAAGAVFSLSKDTNTVLDSKYFDRLADSVAPLFFLSVGMQITEIGINKPEVFWYVFLVVIAAIIGKLFCPWIIASSLVVKERWLLGMALLPRGEVGLIVASIGFQQQHISHHGMIALVVMTLVTALLPSIAIPIISKKMFVNSIR